jgi:hypothetical protein
MAAKWAAFTSVLLFAPEDRAVVRTFRDQCGANRFPFRDNPPDMETERIRFAVLKLSKGKVA